MIALALMLQAAVLPHYNDLPNPSHYDVHACAVQYDRLQAFVGRFKTVVFNRETDRGGRLSWTQGNDIRYAADLTARPYLEHIRQIAYTGAVADCTALADEGVTKVTDEVIRPVFGQ